MKVLITGSYCSGKTTLSHQLQASLGNSILTEEVTREVLDLFGKVDWSIHELRDYVLIKHLIEERRAEHTKAEYIIVDAGIVSLIAHDRVLLASPPDRLKCLEYFNHSKYDTIFFCNHKEIPIKDDGQRFTDEDLRDKIGSAVEETLISMGLSDFIILQGSPIERLEHAMRVLRGTSNG